MNPTFSQTTRSVPASRRLQSGALREFVYTSKLWLKDSSAPENEAQTRDIHCIVQELGDASLNIPVESRLSEVVPTQLTPRLRIFKKLKNGLKGTEVVSRDGVAPVSLKMNDQVWIQ